METFFDAFILSRRNASQQRSTILLNNLYQQLDMSRSEGCRVWILPPLSISLIQAQHQEEGSNREST